MSPALQNATIFLVNAVFSLYIFVLLVRLILAWVRADYHNPLCQAVIKLTQPLIRPLRRIIPNFKNLELATVVVVIGLEIIKLSIASFLKNIGFNVLSLLLLTFADIVTALLNIFFYAILIQAVLSWIHQSYSPVRDLLMKITSPILRPLRRIIPPIGGIDVTPIAAMILLQFLNILIIGMLVPDGLGIVAS